MYIAVKVIVTALIIVAISETARRSSLLAAALASLPLTSILAFIWIYYESRDTDKIISLSYDILWLVIPSLIFFILLPVFLKMGMRFPLALLFSCGVMSGGYLAMIAVKRVLFP